jgi:hypothetical protein
MQVAVYSLGSRNLFSLLFLVWLSLKHFLRSAVYLCALIFLDDRFEDAGFSLSAEAGTSPFNSHSKGDEIDETLKYRRVCPGVERFVVRRLPL